MSYDELPTTETDYKHDYDIVVETNRRNTFGSNDKESVEREAKELERSLNQLSGYESASVHVVYRGPELCKYCEYEMETDDDGMPVCCKEAREHMTAQAVAGEEIE